MLSLFKDFLRYFKESFALCGTPISASSSINKRAYSNIASAFGFSQIHYVIDNAEYLDAEFTPSHPFVGSSDPIDIVEYFKYVKNKEEIEYRIKNASKSSDFQCSLANLVESYYRGQVDCLNDINKSFEIVFRKETPAFLPSMFNFGKAVKNMFGTNAG